MKKIIFFIIQICFFSDIFQASFPSIPRLPHKPPTHTNHFHNNAHTYVLWSCLAGLTITTGITLWQTTQIRKDLTDLKKLHTQLLILMQQRTSHNTSPQTTLMTNNMFEETLAEKTSPTTSPQNKNFTLPAQPVCQCQNNTVPFPQFIDRERKIKQKKNQQSPHSSRKSTVELPTVHSDDSEHSQTTYYVSISSTDA